MSLREIADLSREFGSDPRYVLAGGGNTSYKTEEHLYIKASGFRLATLDESGFVKMRRDKLGAIWSNEYSDQSDEREKRALVDLMAARESGEEEKRPSVETLLHEAMPDNFVAHTHPSLVNGITCSREGKEAALKLFGDSMVWVPSVNPGYILALAAREALLEHRERTGKMPEYLLLQNHGVFISGADIDSVRTRYTNLFGAIKEALVRCPDDSSVSVDRNKVERISSDIGRVLEELGETPISVEFTVNRESLKYYASLESFAPVSSVYTPDQIVYCGFKPLFIDSNDPGENNIAAAVRTFFEENSVLPKLIVVKGLGAFGCGSSAKAAENAACLSGDSVRVAVYSESFGGGQFLVQSQIDFIKDWEVEHYRASVGSGKEGGAK